MSQKHFILAKCDGEIGLSLGLRALISKGVNFTQAFCSNLHVIEHLETYDENVTRDFVDAYLHEMNLNKDTEHSSFRGEEGLTNLRVVLLDLFVAGMYVCFKLSFIKYVVKISA